jgi:hypothetical protein
LIRTTAFMADVSGSRSITCRSRIWVPSWIGWLLSPRPLLLL